MTTTLSKADPSRPRVPGPVVISVDAMGGDRGPAAVARLQGRGADIRVTNYPFGDHSLFGEDVRAAMLADLLALVDETLPREAELPAESRV